MVRPGTLGARMTGGGFAGCTVNLLSEEIVEEFKTQIANNYKGENSHTS